MIESFRKLFKLGIYSVFAENRLKFALSKHFGPEHMDIALNDEHWKVRLAAVKSKFFGPEHMEIALNDEDHDVRVAAVKSKHFGSEHMGIALNDEAWIVRCAAVESEHFEAKHMEIALRDENWNVRHAAVLSEFFGPEHMSIALQDEFWGVRHAAKNTEAYKEYIKPKSTGLKEGTVDDVIQALYETKDCEWHSVVNNDFVIFTKTHTAVMRKNDQNYEISLFSFKRNKRANITIMKEHDKVKELYECVKKGLSS